MLDIRRFTFVGVILASALAATVAPADDRVPNDPQPRWWKGNIHTHSLWSDGDDFPEMISEWYRTRDYNFLAITDHNILSVGQKWMKLSEVKRRGGEDALAKYRARFGADWVVTRGEPGNANHEVLLKPLNEFRALIEERGKFILVQGEEISDRSEGKPVHMNATNLRDLLAPVGGATVREAIANNFRAVREQADRSKREILLHLNHPNFGLAVTAEDLAAVTAERFFEIYNGHPGVQQLGDANHPSVERLWDIANTIRLGELKAPPMFGVGTDDSHDYHGSPGSRPGRGWVMVRSRYLTPNHLVRAMKAGDFYASSGVVLNDVSYDPSTRLLKVDIRPVQGARFTTRFIGTLADYDAKSVARQDANGKPIRSSRKYSDDVGRVLGETEGLSASIRLSGKELYVRAVVTSSVDHPDPSYAKQKQQAWTQPVGWRTRLK